MNAAKALLSFGALILLIAFGGCGENSGSSVPSPSAKAHLAKAIREGRRSLLRVEASLTAFGPRSLKTSIALHEAHIYALEAERLCPMIQGCNAKLSRGITASVIALEKQVLR